MLLGTPAYAPTILYSQNRMRSGRTLKADRRRGPFGGWQPGIYRLVVVHDGRHDVDLIDDNFTVDAGDSYLLQPGALRWVTVGRGSLAHTIGFIAARVPGSELIHEQGHAYRLRDTSHHQPPSENIWGWHIPAHLGPARTRSISEDMAQAVAIAWRDQWQRAEADQLLGRILMTLASERGGPLSDPMSRQSPPPATAAEPHLGWMEGFEYNLDRRLDTLRTTADLARMVGVSTDHFARVFKRLYDCSPAVFLRRRRLQEAARHLVASDADLTSIARQVGFRDATALAHAWRAAHGVSPGRWRRQRSR